MGDKEVLVENIKLRNEGHKMRAHAGESPALSRLPNPLLQLLLQAQTNFCLFHSLSFSLSVLFHRIWVRSLPDLVHALTIPHLFFPESFQLEKRRKKSLLGLVSLPIALAISKIKTRISSKLILGWEVLKILDAPVCTFPVPEVHSGFFF